MATGSVRTLPELPPGSRYELLFKLASGGMASVYVGRIRGAGGFWRLVAIKRAHPHLMEDASFRRMLVEEARLASRIHHPNVVAVQDVEQVDDQLLLVMDYVEGASLADILAMRERPLPPRLAVRIALDACAGLRAAHELTDAAGTPLHLVHRDVSPQNLLVGVDGVARLADFGIAKSTQHASTTTTGALKGKIAYMAPEYVDGKPPDQRSDVFGLGVVIWEALANRRLFRGDTEVDTLKRVVSAEAPLLSTVAPHVGTELDPVLAAALAKDPEERFASAKALGNALEIAARRADLIAPAEEVGAFVRSLFEAPLAERRRMIQERVAADAGPAIVHERDLPEAPPLSGRPTVPMPRSATSEGPAHEVDRAPAKAASPSDAHVRREGTPTSTEQRVSAAFTSVGSSESTRSSSTLDGSGISRPSAPPASSAIPVRSRRPLFAIAAVGALAVGALAALALTRFTASSPLPDAASTSGASAPPGAIAPPGSSAASAAVVPGSAVPPPTVATSSGEAPRAPSATATTSARPPSTAPSAKKPARTSPTSTAAAEVLPNPYGAK